MCRTLSFKGAEFDVIEVPLETDMQVISFANVFISRFAPSGNKI